MNRLRTPLPIILSLILFCAALASACANEETPSSSDPESSPAQVSSSFVTDVVSAEGVVIPHQEADLSFKAPGRITQILVSEGGEVDTGAELARLETRDLEQALLQAKAGLASAEAQLAKLKAGARSEEIASAQAQVDIAAAGVQAAMSAIAIAEGRVEGAEADLAVTEDAVTVARGALASAQAGLRSAQANLNKVRAGATDVQLEIAQKQVEQAKNELWALQEQRDATRGILQGQLAAAEVAVQIAELLVADLESGPRPEDVSIAQALVTEAQAGIQSAQAQVGQAESAVSQARAGLEIARAQVDQAEAELASAKARETQAQAQLELTKAGSRSEDIAAAEAVVTQAQATLAAAENALDDAILRAPFAGTIGAILANEGELVNAQVPIIKLGDLTSLDVQTEDLSEVDVGYVALDQPATITIDALGGTTLSGRVIRIAPTASDRRGEKVYTVRIEIDPEIPPDLRWGMSTFVEIDVR